MSSATGTSLRSCPPIFPPRPPRPRLARSCPPIFPLVAGPPPPPLRFPLRRSPTQIRRSTPGTARSADDRGAATNSESAGPQASVRTLRRGGKSVHASSLTGRGKSHQSNGGASPGAPRLPPELELELELAAGAGSALDVDVGVGVVGRAPAPGRGRTALAAPAPPGVAPACRVQPSVVLPQGLRSVADRGR